MLKKLRYLFKIRSWLKSNTLQGGGIVGLLGAAEVFLRGEDGMGVIALIAQTASLSYETTSGLLLGIVGLAMLGLRAKTERSLAEK